MAKLGEEDLELNKRIQKKAVKLVLDLLKDENNEVREAAVLCFVPLMRKLNRYWIGQIISQLFNNFFLPDNRLRKMSHITLKTIITLVPTNLLPKEYQVSLPISLMSADHTYQTMTASFERGEKILVRRFP